MATPYAGGGGGADIIGITIPLPTATAAFGVSGRDGFEDAQPAADGVRRPGSKQPPTPTTTLGMKLTCGDGGAPLMAGGGTPAKEVILLPREFTPVPTPPGECDRRGPIAAVTVELPALSDKRCGGSCDCEGREP